MPARVIHHLRRHILSYVAIFLALGGGWAIAKTTRDKTIRACVVKHTGELLIRAHCGHGQRRLIFNQQGRQGPRGAQGTQGPAGASAVSVWASVAGNGQVFSGQGLSVQRTAPGTYQVTVTASGCAQGFNAPTVTLSDANPPNGEPAGAFPTDWIELSGGHFTVFTGVVVNGSFTATDHTFDVQDACS